MHSWYLLLFNFEMIYYGFCTCVAMSSTCIPYVDVCHDWMYVTNHVCYVTICMRVTIGIE